MSLLTREITRARLPREGKNPKCDLSVSSSATGESATRIRKCPLGVALSEQKLTSPARRRVAIGGNGVTNHPFATGLCVLGGARLTSLFLLFFVSLLARGFLTRYVSDENVIPCTYRISNEGPFGGGISYRTRGTIGI